MLKKIGIFLILFLVMGCSKGDNVDVSKEFQKRVEKSKSYKIIGNLELQNDEEIFKYNVEVNYLDGNYYKVDVVNKVLLLHLIKVSSLKVLGQIIHHSLIYYPL